MIHPGPFVRVRCADYGDEWIVECDTFAAGEPEPHTTGPYRFGTEHEAKVFVETSLRSAESPS